MPTEVVVPIEYQQQIEKLEKEILKLKKGGFGLAKNNLSKRDSKKSKGY